MSPARAAPAVRFEATPYAITGRPSFGCRRRRVTSCRPVARCRSRRPPTGTRARPSSNRTASPATGCGSARSNSWPLRSAPGDHGSRARAPRGLAGANGVTRIFRPPSLRRRTRSRSCEGHHADGVLGAGSVGECDPESRHAPAPRRSQHLEDAEREAPAVLFQPGRVHRPRPFEERQADQSAMIHLAYAVSEPCDPREVRQG